MSASSLSRALVVACIVGLVVSAVPGALAAGSYGLDSPSAVDVPDGVVSGDGEFFTVSDIARVARGEQFVVQATAPAGTAYEVELRGMSGLVVDVSSRTLRGNDSTSFETEHLEPGSYVAVLTADGESKRVLPVVVEGYNVSTDAPGTVETGADATVTARLEAEPTAPPVSRVDLVVVDQESGEVVSQRAMEGDPAGYTATIRFDEPGTYGLWVGVRGERSVRGHREVLGFGDAHGLSVTASRSPTGTAAPTTAAPTGAPTTVPEGVITRTPTDEASLPTGQPTGFLSVVLGLLLAVGFAFLYLSRP